MILYVEEVLYAGSSQTDQHALVQAFACVYLYACKSKRNVSLFVRECACVKLRMHVRKRAWAMFACLVCMLVLHLQKAYIRATVG